jgi:hypothetical protein
LGSKINPAKTEVLTPPSYSDYVSHEAKTEFKWLGYSLKIDKTNLISPTDIQFDKKIAVTSRMMDDVLSYVSEIKVRHRVYKVWAAPVIEFFMLQHTFHTSVYT